MVPKSDFLIKCRWKKMNQINNNSFILFLSKIYISLPDTRTIFYIFFFFFYSRIEWYTIFHPVLYHSSLNPKKNLNYGKWHVWGQLLHLDQVSIRMRPPQAAVINVTVSTLNPQLGKVILSKRLCNRGKVHTFYIFVNRIM